MSHCSRLQSEDTFPYDALDEIFSYTVGCHDSLGQLTDRLTRGRRQAFLLAQVCRFWHQRFLSGEAMWRVIIRQSPHATAANWTSHGSARRAYLQAKSLTPLLQEELTPIEDCSFTFQCPMFVEDLTYKGDRTYFCDGCKKNVYHVLTDEEKKMRAAKGDCVMLFAGAGNILNRQSKRIPPNELNRNNEPLVQNRRELPKEALNDGPPLPTSIFESRKRIAVLAKDEMDMEKRVKPMLRHLSCWSEGTKVRYSHNCFPTITIEVETGPQSCTFYFHAMLESEAKLIVPSDLPVNERFDGVITADPIEERVSSVFATASPLPAFNRPTPFQPHQDSEFNKLEKDNPALRRVCGSLSENIFEILVPSFAPPPIMMGVPPLPGPPPPIPTSGSLPPPVPPPAGTTVKKKPNRKRK